MIRIRFHLIVALVFCALIQGYGPLGAEEKASLAKPEYKDFKIILNRNIFDPDRRPKTVYTPVSTRKTKTRTKERIHLMGSLISDTRTISFWDGSGLEGSGELNVGENVAGYRICKILTDKVSLEKEGRRLEVPIDSSLVMNDAGDWEIGSADAEYFREEVSPDNTTEKKSSGDEQESGDMNDLLKKMMERRKREIDQ